MSDDRPDIGHNTISGTRLQQIIKRIEALEENKKEIAQEIKDVYDEAKGDGYDVKIIRKVVQLRKRRPEDVSEEQAMLDLYMHALGMLPG